MRVGEGRNNEKEEERNKGEGNKGGIRVAVVSLPGLVLDGTNGHIQHVKQDLMVRQSVTSIKA